MRFQFALQATKLFLLGSELLLIGTNQRQQGVAIEAVQIGQRSATHARSMASCMCECIHKTRMNTGESAWSSDREFRSPRPLDSAPVNAFEQHRQLCARERNRAGLHLRPHKTPLLQALRQ